MAEGLNQIDYTLCSDSIRFLHLAVTVIMLFYQRRSQWKCWRLSILFFLVKAQARSSTPNWPEFNDYASMEAYVNKFGIRYLDLGSSKGVSRRGMAKTLKTSLSSILGLDVSDEKLAICNSDGAINCAKGDLRQVFNEERPSLVEGTQMIDILEHINKPASNALEVPAPRRRHVWGHDFDTANHTAAMDLFVAACQASRRFCFQEGPGYDKEDALRNLGFVRYYEYWTGHTCHINSTSMIKAISMVTRARKGAQLVFLYHRVSMKTYPTPLLKLSPDKGDHNCSDQNSARFEFGCDRHPPVGRYADKEKHLPQLRYPMLQTDEAARAVATPIHTRMRSLVLFHDANEAEELRTSLSKEVASLIVSGPPLNSIEIIHCQLGVRRVDQLNDAEACFSALKAEAMTKLKLG